MGGNAIKKVKTSRLDLLTYTKVKDQIKSQLEPYMYIAYIYELPEKESFGDLDLLYVLDPNLNIRNIIQKEFSPNEIVSNGDIISFDYNIDNSSEPIYFQVDMIKSKSIKEIPMYQFYYSWGDFGAILGRIFNYNAYKFGQQGLYLNLLPHTIEQFQTASEINDFDNSNTDNGFSAIDQTFDTIQIKLSSDPREICKFVRLDYDRWLQGFQTQTEIIEYLINFEMYDVKIFESLNTDHRKRLQKRPFYLKFIDYIGINSNHIKTTKLNNHSGEIGQNKQLEAILYFDKINELDTYIKEYNLKKIRHEKFNGKMIIEKLNILYPESYDNKLIGYHIIEFKKYVIKYDLSKSFDEYIDNLEKEEITQLINNYFTIFK